MQKDGKEVAGCWLNRFLLVFKGFFIHARWTMSIFRNLFFFVFFQTAMYGAVYHHKIHSENNSSTYVWEKRTAKPFKELILTWKSLRPSSGQYAIYVSLLLDEWGEEHLYALWGKNIQKTFISPKDGKKTRTFQDTVNTVNNLEAWGFKVRIEAKNPEKLQNLRSLHVSIKTEDNKEDILENNDSVFVPVKGLSQMALDTPIRNRICSPTSLTASLRYLCEDLSVDPIELAENSLDQNFDIFGNWTLNTAQANTYLYNSQYVCFPKRCKGFEELLVSLNQGLPCVVSIKGPIKGGALPYQSGHLLVVCGYNPKERTVLCMDPAFSSDEATLVSYQYEDFLQAWGKRSYLAYLFAPF